MIDEKLQEQLEDQLYEKMSAENEAYLADMKTKPVDEIIQSAYQIAWRKNMLYLFDSPTTLTPQQLHVLLELKQPMAELYNCWLKQDTEEMDLLRGCLENHADDILKHRAEEKYNDPKTPLYSKPLREARFNGELFDWRCNHKRSEECARMFRQEATVAYNEQKFPAFLGQWTAAYGKERCMLVLAATMQQRKEDARFSPPARQATAQVSAYLGVDGDHAADYAVNTHSCIVNAAMEHLAKPERLHTPEKPHSKKKTDRER